MAEVMTRNLTVVQDLEGVRCMEHLIEKSTSAIDLSRGLEEYRVFARLIDFGKMEKMLTFMSSRDLKNSYLRSDDYRTLVATMSRYDALIEISAIARKETFATLDLQNDLTLLLGRCSNKTDLISRTAEYLISYMRDTVRINASQKLMQVKVDNQIFTISNYQHSTFAAFIKDMLSNVLSYDDALKIVNQIDSDLNSKYQTGRIIQFRDAYLEDGVLKEGMYDRDKMTRFFIDRNVWNAYKTGQFTKKVKEVDDLLLHLSSFDESVKSRVEDVMSLMFLNSSSLRNRMNKSLRFFGKDGENGKSLFSSLLTRAIGTMNIANASIAKLDDDRVLFKVAQSLVMIDGDATAKTINDDAAANFKLLSTCERVSVRGLYQEHVDLDSNCFIIAFSNFLPSSSDKSDAYLRRLEIVKCEYQLKKTDIGPNSKATRLDISDQFFKNLNSEEAAQYLIEKLVIRSQEVRERGLKETPTAMKTIIEIFRDQNDSASAYVKDVGLESIVGFSVKEVKKNYQEWCEENDMTILNRKFGESLEDQFGLRRSLVGHRRLNPESEFKALIELGAKANVSAWQFADKDKNEEYFNSLNKETQ